jgi:hypothetical protein
VIHILLQINVKSRNKQKSKYVKSNLSTTTAHGTQRSSRCTYRGGLLFESFSNKSIFSHKIKLTRFRPAVVGRWSLFRWSLTHV